MFYRRTQADQAYLVLVSLLVVLLTLVAPAAPGLAATANAERFAAPQAVTPVVSLTVPSTTMISEGFSFTAAFDNTGTGAEVGYGPYVDLFLPIGGVDATSNSGPNDGVTFTSATYLGVAVNSVTQTCAPDGILTHPLTGLSVTCPALPFGFDTSFTWQFINLELPFGSFAADQPAADITVTANLSNYADLSTALPIQARGGFRYGADPLDNPITDPPIIQASLTSADVTPTLIKLTKIYHGPEDETATGPNFPREYTVAVDIADGQTVTNLDISDYLPGNLQFVLVVSTSPAATCGTLPSTTTPGGNLVCTFASVTGTTGTSDATVRFRFYAPLNDAGSNPVINASTGDDVQCINQADALGDWTPLDPRDLGGVDNASAGGSGDPPEHILGCKSIAIQKSVANLTDSTNSPGDVLEYTLNFQVSDFFAFQNVIIDDLVSDGQHFQSSFAPTLQVNGNDFTLAAASMDGGNVNIVCNYTGGPGAECDSDNGAANDGTTAIAFDISAELVTRGRTDGKLLGGCVPTAGGSDYDCDPFDNGATTATLKFRTVILDAYTDDYPSGDPSVDQGDILNNDVTISGDVLNNADLTPTGNSEADTSAAGLTIAQGSLEKTIYAKNGVACAPQPCSAVQGTPGDTITYRLRYTHPTSDFEQFSMEDFVPLPVFSATEVTSLSNTVCGTPAAGAACLGPADTYHLLSGAVTPAMTTNAANNTVKFTYGNFDDPTNPTSVVDILFTVTIEGDPFADGLYLTNQARSTEGTTQTTVRTADAIVQFQIFEPVLGIRKGVIATDKATATFSPAAVAPTNVSVSAPGSACPRLSGSGLPVTSSNLGTTFTSDLNGLDAGDLATFVIVVENTGRGPNGAFDVRIKDDLPAGFVAPAGGINLCATDGTGALFSVTDLGGGLLSTGIELIDPGPTNPAAGALDRGKLADGTTVTDGRNIVILTFDLQLDSSVRPNQAIDNTATLFKYAGQEGGADFTATDRTDSAQVKISPPAFAKALTGTEVTDGDNGATQAVIGELITYELTVTIPEGVTPSAQIADTLATGLAFVDITSVTLSPGVSTANAIGTGANPANVAVAGGGGSFTVNFGNTTNANTDNGVAETIVIVFRAAVLNLAGNQAGTTLGNAATFSYDTGPSLPATAANVTLVEPRVLAGKEVSNDGTTWSASLSTGDASAPLYYRVRLSNGGAALAPNADVATTAELANFTSSGSIPGRFSSVPSPMDGVTLAVGQRVLVKNQTTASQNGIYSITATSSGTFTLNRATDADTAAELYRSRLVKVGSGTANGGQVFELTSTVATLNTDAVVWTSMTSGALTAFDVTLNDPLSAVYASVALNNPVTTAGFGATPAPTFADFEIVGGVLRTKAGVSFDMPAGSSVELVLSGTLSNGVNPQQNLDNIATVLWTSLNDDKSSADTPTQRSVHSASSTERTGADGVAGALNDYAAKGSANAVSPAPILSKLIVASSESHTLENKVLADFTGTGFTSLASTWASAQTTLPEFVRIGSPATGTGGSGTLTFGSAQDLRGYNALGVAVRAAAGNAATTMRLTLTDSDGTTARFDVTMSSLTVGAPGFTQLTSVALTAPSAAPTGGNGVLNLEAIVSIQVAGSANNAVRWDIDRIVALRTLAVPGEIVRYRLTVELPEGTSPDFMVQDNLPSGMRFINDSSVRVAFVANGGGIASTTAGTGNATVPAVTDTGTALNLSGNGDTVSSFSLAVGSVNGLPIGEGTGFDSTVSSSRTDARVTADTYIDGTDPIFRLGTLVNSDNDADAEYVVIEFNALVTNDRDNTAPDNGSAQQAGVSLDNTFQTAINSSTSNNTQVGSTSSANDFSRVIIVEPQINNLSKAITTAPVDAGDPIVYQIEFSNNTAHPAQYAPQVQAATTASFSATFNPTGGTGGTGRFTGAPASVDGVTLAEGDRVLVNNQSSASQNGIYKVVDAINGIWDRATDFDTAAEMNLGYRAFVASGTANGGRTFALDAAVTTINTSAISFSAVSANPAVQAATTGVLPGTYTFNATGGTGGTGRFTWTAAAPTTIDGVTVAAGTRILVKDQNSTAPSAQTQRGVYVVVDTNNWDRASDFDTAAEFPVGIQTYVVGGTNNGGRTFAQTVSVTTINSSVPAWTVVDQVTAFDLVLTDALPPGVLFQSVTIVTPDLPAGQTFTASGPFTGGSVTVPAVGTNGTITVNLDKLAPESKISGTPTDVTITVNGIVSSSAAARQEIVNTARLSYTGLPGDKGTASNPTGTDPTSSSSVDASGGQYGERNGSGVTATDNTPVNYGASIRNNYSVASTVITSLDRPSVSKSFKDGTLTNDDTSLAATSGANLTIGEQATFDILVTLPEGSTPDMVVSDVLPDGLRLDSYAVITLASGSGRLSQDFVGTLTNNPPSVSPALPVTGAGAASFSFGNSAATADGVAGNNAFVLRVTATVLNILGNQNGVTRTNSATVRFDDPAIADRTVTSTGGDPIITVVEPILALTKQQISVAPTPAQVGSVVTYRVTVAHDAGSAAPAYDVRISDALPAGLTLNLGSVSVTLNGSASGAVNNSAGNAIDVSVDAIPNDGSNVVIEYQATVNGNADVTVTNSADALWTTLPGASDDERDEGDGNPDGAELLGSGALNDYEVVGSSNLSVPLDMGDLPDSYGTTAVNGGARHLPNGLTLGSSIDQETNGQPNASATGDGADEDGVSASSPSANWGGGTGAFLVTVNGGPGCLNAWMDFTNDSGSGVGASFADGNFTKTGGYDTYSSFSEHLVQNQLLTNGVTDVTFSVPTSLLGGGSTNYYFRFRLSPTDGNGQCTVPVGPTGLISGGEVEDYQVTFPPLAATLNSFSAEAQGDRIMVIWETVSELDNIGFNLYRSDSATGALNLLAFMPSQGPGSSQGFAYSYDDLDVQIGQTYWYWLEDISVSGVTTLHGPVSATLLQPTAVTLGEWQAGTSQPALLAALLAVAVGLAIVLGTATIRRRRTDAGGGGATC